MSREAWLATLEPGDSVTGPAAATLAARLPQGAVLLPQSAWAPTAASVGRLALQQFRGGQPDDLWRLTPQYYRRSAAEEKWERERRVKSEE
jgi:tRNA threonylcarbamoyladenosine biosynthesis protein TsaB